MTIYYQVSNWIVPDAMLSENYKVTKKRKMKKKLIIVTHLLGTNELDKILLLHCLISYYTSSHTDKICFMDLLD